MICCFKVSFRPAKRLRTRPERQRTGRHGTARLPYRFRRVWMCGNAHASFSSNLPRLPRLDTPATRRLPPAAHRRRPLLSRCAYRAEPPGRTYEAGGTGIGRLRFLLQRTRHHPGSKEGCAEGVAERGDTHTNPAEKQRASQAL